MLFNKTRNRMMAVIWLALTGMTSTWSATLETQLSSDQIKEGESVVVTYILNDSTAQRVSPDFSALQKDFRVVNTYYGNAINMVNGVTTTQTFWRLWLQPKSTGVVIIPEIAFNDDKSIARRLEVISSQTPQSAPAVSDSHDAPVFVRAEVSSTSPYVEAQVVYTFKLFFRTQLRDPSIELPQIKDVTFLQLEDGHGSQATINGKTYNVVEKNFAIFPKKPGVINISPIQLHAFKLDDRASFNDDPFNFDVPKPVTLATKAFNLTVRDVPADYQGTTWLPAKNVSLTEQWSNYSGYWEEGTPVTRTITMIAQGLRADQLPDLVIEKITGVNVYVDRPKRNNTMQDNMVVGIVEQKVTYIPDSSHSFIVPPLKMNWWNTQTNTNASTILNSMAVHVKAAPGRANAPAHAAPAQPAALPAIPKSAMTAYAFYKSIWFWIACVLLAAWIVTLWSLLRKRPAAVEEETAAMEPVELSEKDFANACQSGAAMQAQQFLLSWAKDHWPDEPLNLATLRELIDDQQFKQALQELEQALYGKKTVVWQGSKLLAAFLKVKKSGSAIFAADSKSLNSLDPLPPLNPGP